MNKKAQHIKIRVNNNSKEIQEILFELGFIWHLGNKNINHTDKPYLYTDSFTILYGEKEEKFIKDSNKEVTLEELKKIINLQRNNPSNILKRTKLEVKVEEYKEIKTLLLEMEFYWKIEKNKNTKTRKRYLKIDKEKEVTCYNQEDFLKNTEKYTLISTNIIREVYKINNNEQRRYTNTTS